MCWARNDATPATLYFPGTLAFGPNGNLYVADLDAGGLGAGAIYQFDTNSTTQQFLSANTLVLPSGFTPLVSPLPRMPAARFDRWRSE